MIEWRQAGFVGCLTLLVTLSGVLESLERSLMTFRFGLEDRPASGEIVVVQIDARTIREMGTWPFARADHARAIDALHDIGVSTIAFDVELTQSPNEADNAKLVAALNRAGGHVILPSFMQLASAGQGSEQTIRTEPANMFAEHAWIANVNVFPSSDHVHFLHRHFEPVKFEECRAKVPYMPLVRTPYYIFIGKKREHPLPE